MSSLPDEESKFLQQILHFLRLNLVVVNVFCEFFEIVVHSILYIRKLYPETVFLPKKKYDTVVYQCIQPKIVEYIVKCLSAIKFHASRNQLKRIFLCIHTDNEILKNTFSMCLI